MSAWVRPARVSIPVPCEGRQASWRFKLAGRGSAKAQENTEEGLQVLLQKAVEVG